MLMVILIACQEPNLPVGPLSVQSLTSTGASPAVRLTAHRWVQVEERWLGFPQQVIRHPFSKWSTCATDDEFVFTPSGEFYWYSGPTECTDTTPATPLPIQNQYDLYPQRSHRFTILAEGDSLLVGAMGVRPTVSAITTTMAPIVADNGTESLWRESTNSRAVRDMSRP